MHTAYFWADLGASPKPENEKENNIFLHVNKRNAFADLYTLLNLFLAVLMIINHATPILLKRNL